MSEEKKVLLSLKDVDVKFNVRGRILQAIRHVSLDIYENESLAIVGESGSGKSVLTKTFAGLLEQNGFISNGSIIFSDDEISKTDVQLTPKNVKLLERCKEMLNKNSVFERGVEEYLEIKRIEKEIEHSDKLTEEEETDFAARIKTAKDNIVDATNYLWTLDKKNAEDAVEIDKTEKKIDGFKAEIKAIEQEKAELIKTRKAEVKANPKAEEESKARIAELKAIRNTKIATADNENNPYGLTDEVIERNNRIAYELLLSIGRYPAKDKIIFMRKLDKAFKLAMSIGEDLNNTEILNKIFEVAAFRVELREIDEAAGIVHGYAILDCAKIKLSNDWQQIRGCRIATVFQDPMTSLNPVITIGKQIMTVILKHQKCSQEEAKQRTIDIMAKVGIPDPEKRFNDYPFEYSGGMRQRIVIAIALSCQPKILICDEPTTALDVTIQAQIIRLIKDLQKELGFTTVYITHDLGVVANVAERVAVIYGGQIVEVGTVDEIFYEPKHPYTWALLSSLPQLAEKGTELFSIPGTPPSLYNKIVGDAFAPRNKYAMAIDLAKEPPVFHVSETHWAKTWLLDPRAPKTEAPMNIQNLHEKMLRSYVNFDSEGEVKSAPNAVIEPAQVENKDIVADEQEKKSEKHDIALSIKNLDVVFRKGKKGFKAVDNVSFDIFKGETLSLVGESGSGKTTIGRAIVRINPCSAGEILYNGKRISGKLSHKDDRDVVRKIQMIFQDPSASLNERATIEYIISEGLYNFHLYKDEKDRIRKVEEITKEVGLLPEHLTRYPHEFSGGQRQRVGLARSIVMEPEFIIADEPISALDVSIRAQVLNLLKKFQRDRGLTYLFIAHDLSIVRFISDRIVVIYKGRIMEIAESEELFAYPLHPYTKSLISAIPVPDPIIEKSKKLLVYDPSKHDYSTSKPELVDLGNGHMVFGNEAEIAEYKRIRFGK